MSTVNVNIKDLGRYEMGLARSWRGKCDEGLNVFAGKALQKLRKGSTKIFDLGRFRSSWMARRAPGRLEIFNAASHSVFVERGRRRNRRMPPLKIIEMWARRRGIVNPARAAWPIARAIARRGVKGRPVLSASKFYFWARVECAKCVARAWFKQVMRGQ